jgi:hypothetical protein
MGSSTSPETRGVEAGGWDGDCASSVQVKKLKNSARNLMDELGFEK